jgi:hypothetical protein
MGSADPEAPRSAPPRAPTARPTAPNGLMVGERRGVRDPSAFFANTPSPGSFAAASLPPRSSGSPQSHATMPRVRTIARWMGFLFSVQPYFRPLNKEHGALSRSVAAQLLFIHEQTRKFVQPCPSESTSRALGSDGGGRPCRSTARGATCRRALLPCPAPPPHCGRDPARVVRHGRETRHLKARHLAPSHPPPPPSEIGN